MGTTAKPQFMVVMDFKLLAATLNAGIINTESEQHIFIRQDRVAENDGVDLDELVAEINRLIGKDDPNQFGTADVLHQLAPLSEQKSLDPKRIRFKLTTVYLDIRMPTDNPTKRVVEYAFRLDVDAKDVFREKMDFISIDKLAIAVWNTKDNAILTQLNIPVL